MTAQNPNVLVLSHAVYGATPAATYAFMTKGFKPPAQARYLDHDIVKNQNGKFKYIYDNGPGFKAWSPFSIICEDTFAALGLGSAATQFARINEMWEHPGVLGMASPDGRTYVVHWSSTNLEQNFRVFPHKVNDKLEQEVIVQFEEA